jgi:hypothetical protein
MSYSPKVFIDLNTIPVEKLKLDMPVTFMLPKQGGTATAGVLVRNLNPNDCDSLFGAHSILSASIKAFAKVNSAQQINAFPTDITGVAATAEMTDSGTSTSAGKYKIWIDGISYEYNFASGATMLSVYTALVAIINADANRVVQASLNTNNLLLTHKTNGIIGNYTQIAITIYNSDGVVNNCGFTFVGAVAFTGGTGLPTIATLASELENEQTHLVVDYSVISDNTLGIAIIDLLKSRIPADNLLTAGGLFFYTPSASAYAALSNAKYKSGFLFPIGEKIGNNANLRGSYNRNAWYKTLATMIAVEMAIVNPNARTNLIKSGTLYGARRNFGVNLSGYLLPYLNVNTDLNSQDLKGSDIEEFSSTGITCVWSNGTSMEIANEGYTANINPEYEVEKFFGVYLIRFAFQVILFQRLKGDKFKNQKNQEVLRKLIESEIKNLIRECGNQLGEYNWLEYGFDTIAKRDKLESQVNTVLVSVNQANRSRLIASMTIVPLLPYTGIDATVNFSLVI